jgi:hypothetical protein
VVATLSSGSYALAIDDANAYVDLYETGPVYRVALDGSGITPLYSFVATNIAVDATSVFAVGTSGQVVSCDKRGCNGQYTTIAENQSGAWGLAANERGVYWTSQSTAGGVTEALFAGGGVDLVTQTGPAHGIVVSGGTIFYTGQLQPGPGQEAVLSIPIAGGSPTILVPPDPADNPLAIAVDCTNVYFATNDGSRSKVSRAGGAVTTLATGQGYPSFSMAVDADRLYFIDDAAGEIRSVPIAGGDVTTVASGQSNPGAIAVDAMYVYWTNLGDGTLMKAAK